MTTTTLRPRFRASSLAALASVPLLVLGLAACSPASSEEDSGSGVKSDSQIASDALAWDVASAQCMRDAGFDVPDPSSDGTKQSPNFDDDTDVEAFARASDECQAKVQGDLGPRPVTAAEKGAQQEGADATRKINECLREKGFDVSDPVAGGSGVTKGLEKVPDEALEACGLAGGGGAVTVER